MTKNNENMLSNLISKIHKSAELWDISSFYEFCLSNNYTKSKRTLERELLELDFYSKVTFSEEDDSLKKIVQWQKICDTGADMHGVCINEINEFIKDSQ